LIFDHIIFASQNSKFAFGRISTSAPAKAINFWPPGAAKPFCGGTPRAAPEGGNANIGPKARVYLLD